jgi:hypothetical protein
VDRTEFEAIRNVPEKLIRGDIRFSRSKNASPLLVADGIRIENSSGAALFLNISYNPLVGSKTLNIVQSGVGPICRLDVDGPAHRPAGRSHKHSVQTERCPDRNLPDGVMDRPDLSGQTMRQLFDHFCQLANIRYEGVFEDPDAAGGER